MPYEFLAKNGLISQGNTTVTGSLVATQNITGSNITASGTGSFGRVGIGTNSASTNLDIVTSGGTADVNAIRIFRNTDTLNDGISIKFDTNTRTSAIRHIQPGGGVGTLCFDVQGSEKVRIDGSGNVGIGTTVPTGSLHVYQAIGVGETAIATIQEGAGGAAELVFRSGNASTNRRGALRFYSNQISTTTAQWTIGASMDQTSGDNSFYFYNASSTSILTLSQTNVGIGVNPVAKLQVAGNISGSSFTSSVSNAVGFLGTSSWAQTANSLNTGNSYIIAGLTNNGTLSQQGTLSMGSGYQILATTGTAPSPGIAFVGDTNTGIYSPGADTIGFSISGSESSRIDSSGNLLISTTTSPSHAGISLGSTGTVRQLLGGMQNTSWRIRERDQIDALAITTNINDSGTQDSAARSSWKLRMGWGNGQDNFLISRSPAGSSTFSDLFLVKSDGSVGIGTTNPSTILTISKPIDASAYGSGSRAIDFKLYYPGFDVDSVKASIYVGVSNQGTLQTTKGYLAFLTSATSGSQNLTEKMRIEADGNVGIGTSNPIYKLDLQNTSSTARLGNAIVGAFPVDGNYALFGHNSLNHSSSATNYALLQESNGSTYLNAIGQPIYFRIANTNKMILNSSGQFGIGTTSPITGYLDVRSNQTKSVAGPTNIAFFGSGDGGSPLGLVLNHESSSGVKMVGLVGTEYGSSGNNIKINETLHVQYSGGVGVGTVSPSAKFQVVQTAAVYPMAKFTDTVFAESAYLSAFTNAGGNTLGFSGLECSQTNSTTRRLWIGTDSPYAVPEAFVGTPDNLPLVFYTSGSSRMFISSSGNIGIGTTSPTQKLEIQGNSQFGNDNVTNIGLKITRLNGGMRTSEHTYHSSQNSPWYTYGQNLTWTGELAGTVEPTQVYRPYFEAFAPAVGYKVFGFMGVNTGSFTSADAINALTIKNDGNIGIGTTNPATKLHLSGTGSTELRITSTTSNTNSLLSFYELSLASWGIDAGQANGSFFIKDLYNTRTVLTLNSSGNVGIGTTGPSYKLDVSGSAIRSFVSSGSAEPGFIVDYPSSNGYGAFFVHVNGTRRWRIGSVGDLNAEPSLNFHQEGTGSRMIIGSNGYVGIGTSGPSGNLDVYSSAGSSHYVRSSVSAMRFLAYGDGTNWIQSGTSTSNSSADLIFSSMNGVTQWMRIQGSTGNVGIGTTSPSELFTVYGTNKNIRISNTAAYNASGTAYLGFDGVYNSSNAFSWFSRIVSGKENTTDGDLRGYFAIQTNNASSGIAERVRVDSNGNVGIGSNNPQYKLDVVGLINATSAPGSYGTIVRIRDTVTAGTESFAGVHFTSSPGTDYTIGKWSTAAGAGLLQIRDQSGNQFVTINGSGNVGIGTTTLTARLHVSGSTGGIFEVDTVGGATTFYVTASGNVGIGTNAPAYRLDVTGGDVNFASNSILRFGTVGVLNLSSNANDIYANIRVIRNSSTTSQDGMYIGYDGTGTTGAHLRFYANGITERMRIDASNGNVGIGTTTPVARLEISGSSNSALLNIKSPISGAILYVSGSGAVGIGTSAVGAYTLQVSGSFGATTKSFIIEHPTKEGKKLVYGSLESPYHGIRLTGRDTLIDGKCKVQLPDYIYKLILHDSVNIQLTGIKCNKVLYIDEINVPENYFTIAYDKAVFETYKDYDFFWDFTAIRADVPELETEI